MTLKEQLRIILYKKYKVSFSKSGEDIQLNQLLKRDSTGVYVDIGSWHPIKASNSYYFYLRGWKGICIDPNPELVTLYADYRPRDIFINLGVSNRIESLTYHIFNESSMNTFDSQFIEENNLNDQVLKKRMIDTKPLSMILEKNLQPTDRLDFFDIDVEGLDMEVLISNDWLRFRPKLILIETNLKLESDFNSDLTKFLLSKDYQLIGKSVINHHLGNLFYIDNHQI